MKNEWQLLVMNGQKPGWMAACAGPLPRAFFSPVQKFGLPVCDTCCVFNHNK
jgi:hypothetical protein